jgi:hypothetical protein
MKVGLHSNVTDQETSKISGEFHEPFRTIANELSGEYGGLMEHLWIDFELNRHHAELRPPFRFRFQKRVSGRNPLTGIDSPDYHHVGHYSVRPDFDLLLRMPIKETVGYALGLIYESTTVLEEKAKKLGGFDAHLFRARFAAACLSQGYAV